MTAPFELFIPPNRPLTGGDLVAQSLAALGVDTAFGLHGGHLDAFLVGCGPAGIRLVDTRHETVAVRAAEGYAKMSGKLGVCFVTANSGFSNALPGLATALADRSPILCLTSSQPARDAETNALQGFHDQIVAARPVTKFAHRVTAVEEIPRLVAHAARLAAQSGAPGPALLDIPIDVLFGPPRVAGISWGSIGQPASCVHPPAPSPAAIGTLLEWWKAAKRPVLITGTGALGTAGGPHGNLLLQLAEQTSTPVFFSAKAATPSAGLSWAHQLRGGPASALAYLGATGKAVPDLVIILGARTGFLLGGRGGAVIPHGAKKVQIDVDGGEMGRSLPVDLGIVADASQFILAVLAALAKDPWDWMQRHEEESWVETCAGLKAVVHQQYHRDAETNADDQTLHPYHAINGLYKALAPLHPVLVVDGGECGVWGMDLWESAEPFAGMNATGYLGFLGNGFGYALGAALAHPDRVVVNLQGDGSAGFHLAELDTYVRHGLKVLTVVVNNLAWGMSRAGQDLVYGGAEPARPVSALSPTCDFKAVAEGLGCVAVHVYRPEELEDKVRLVTSEMVLDGRAGLVNLVVSQKPVTAATTAMVGLPSEGATADGDDHQNAVVVPYYDNVPRAYYAEELRDKGWTRG